MAENKPVDIKAEVYFLIDNSAIAPHRVAEIIAGEGGAAEQLGVEVAEKDRARNPPEGFSYRTQAKTKNTSNKR